MRRLGVLCSVGKLTPFGLYLQNTSKVYRIPRKKPWMCGKNLPGCEILPGSLPAAGCAAGVSSGLGCIMADWIPLEKSTFAAAFVTLSCLLSQIPAEDIGFSCWVFCFPSQPDGKIIENWPWTRTFVFTPSGQFKHQIYIFNVWFFPHSSIWATK